MDTPIPVITEILDRIFTVKPRIVVFFRRAMETDGLRDAPAEALPEPPHVGGPANEHPPAGGEDWWNSGKNSKRKTLPSSASTQLLHVMIQDDLGSAV
jgi:hypothetical protein